MSKVNQTRANKFKCLPLNLLPPSDQNKANDNQKPSSLVTITPKISQQTKLATYKNLSSQLRAISEPTPLYNKAFQVFSKAHYTYRLRFETLFLAYSIFEKTYHMADKMESLEYFIACCLFLAMKYQEIYPPRLKDVALIIKSHIKKDIYEKCEVLMLQELKYNLNFEGLNQEIGQYLMAMSGSQKYFFFYLLELALSNRSQLKSFTLKEIVTSVAYVLCSHSMYVSPKDQIDGIKFPKIENCSKMIIISQTFSQNKFPTIYKKYRSDQMKFASMRSLPVSDGVTKLFLKKANRQICLRKSIMSLANLKMDQEVTESDKQGITQ